MSEQRFVCVLCVTLSSISSSLLKAVVNVRRVRVRALIQVDYDVSVSSRIASTASLVHHSHLAHCAITQHTVVLASAASLAPVVAV